MTEEKKDEKKEDEEDPEEEPEPEPKKKHPALKSKTPPAKDDTESALPEIKIKEEIIADFTPMGWVLFGCVVASVILYSWYRNRKEQGKGMLPDSVQARMQQAQRPHIAEQ